MVNGIGARQTLDAGCVGNLLVGDYTRDGSGNVDDPRGMVLVHTEKVQLLGGCTQIDFGILLGVFRLFEGALCDRALVVKSLLSFELLPRQPFIVHGLQICLVCPGNIVASNPEQQLAFFHGVAQPGLNLHHSSRSERDYRHGARDIGLHYAGHVQGRRRLMLNRSRQWKLVWVVHFEVVRIQVRLDGGRGRGFGLRVRFIFAAARKNEHSQAQQECRGHTDARARKFRRGNRGKG